MTEKAKRNTQPLTVGRAVDAILALSTAQYEAERQAVAAVQERFRARREAIYARVPRHLIPAVDGALDAMLKSGEVQAFSSPSAQLDDDNPEDEAPSEPEQHEIPERLREPLSKERLAIARGR